MEKLNRVVKIVFIAVVLSQFVNLINIFFFTPAEASMGIIQKIFYVHVPSALNMYIGFAVGFIFSILYLWKRKEIFDAIAYSAIEVGFVFAICVLVSGPLWAKGAWGKFWDFDPRLTSTLIIWFIYFAYILLRKYFVDLEKGKVFSAIIAVIGFLDAPIIHYSVKLWRGIHPNIITSKDAGSSLPASMWCTLIFSAIAFVVLFGFIFLLKLRRVLIQKESGVVK